MTIFDGAGLGGELSHGTSSALLESESWFGVVSSLWGVAAGFFPWKTDVMVTSVTMFTGIYHTSVPSCIYSFWHGVIPTSYFIFNDFYTCFTNFLSSLALTVARGEMPYVLL